MQIFHMLLKGEIFRTPEFLWKAKVSKSFEVACSENRHHWTGENKQTKKPNQLKVLALKFGALKTETILICFHI